MTEQLGMLAHSPTRSEKLLTYVHCTLTMGGFDPLFYHDEWLDLILPKLSNWNMFYWIGCKIKSIPVSSKNVIKYFSFHKYCKVWFLMCSPVQYVEYVWSWSWSWTTLICGGIKMERHRAVNLRYTEIPD